MNPSEASSQHTVFRPLVLACMLLASLFAPRAGAAPKLVWEAPVESKQNQVVAWGWGDNAPPDELSQVKSLAIGYLHSAALLSDGTIVAWGDNTYGQTSVPAGVTAIAAGRYHTVALKPDGTVVACGSNGSGQTSVPAGLTGVIAISAGSDHTVALKSDGTVVAWGSNSYGQTAVPSGLTNVIAIAAGGSHTVALKSDGTVVAWGSSGSGQIAVPAGLTGVTAIAAGELHTVALKSDGTVAAWGSSGRVPVGLTGVTSIAAGSNLTLVLKSDGKVAAWNYNTNVSTWNPQSLTHYSAIAAGYSNLAFLSVSDVNLSFPDLSVGAGQRTLSIKIKNSGNENLSLGALSLEGVDLSDFSVSPPPDSTLAPAASTTVVVTFSPRTPGTKTALLQFASNDPTAVPLNFTGNALPDNNLTSLTTSAGGFSPAFDPAVTTYAMTVPAETTSISLSATVAEPHATLWLRGSQITAESPSPLVPVQRGITRITLTVVAQNGATRNYTLNVTRNAPAPGVELVEGKVAWKPSPLLPWRGFNASVGMDKKILTGIRDGLDSVIALAGNNSITTALKADGTVVAWNSGSFTPSTVPVGLRNVTAIAVGESFTGSPFTLALKSDGTVVAWGANFFKQTTVPPWLSGVVAIAAGTRHSVALRSDGTVVVWGGDILGASEAPYGLTNVIAIAACDDGTVALKADGTVVTLGFGTPSPPVGLSGIVSIATGDEHILGLKYDGSLVAWGRNSQGQTTVPAGLADVVGIAAGGSTSAALKADGTVVAWGYSKGNSDSVFLPEQVDISSVVCVGSLTGDIIYTLSKNTSLGLHRFSDSSNPSVTLAIANNGTTDLVLGEFALGGSNPADFTVSPPVSTSVPPGAKAHFTVTFTPTSPGDRRALLRIPNQSGTVLNLELTGLGKYADPNLSGLELDVGTLSPAFDPTVTAYTLIVPTGTTRMTLKPLVNPQTGGLFSLKNGVVSWPKGDAILLADVDTVFTISVTSQDNFYQKTYEVAVHKISPRLDVTETNLSDSLNHPLRSWGRSGQSSIPFGRANIAGLETGEYGTFVLKTDGTVTAWGANVSVPAGISGVTGIAAGFSHNEFLKSDGTIVAAGISTTTLAVPAGLANVIALAAGGSHAVALKSDGTVVCWGSNSSGKTTVPTGLTGISAISAGNDHTVALKTDGSVVAWGSNSSGQTAVPVGLAGVTAIAAGGQHTLALRTDGTVVAWGSNSSGQITVPAGLTGVTAIGAGGAHSVVLKLDGSVVAWGSNSSGQSTVPAGLTDIAAISAGGSHTVALKRKILRFGNHFKGASSSYPLTFVNNGDIDLIVGPFTQSGPHAMNFAADHPDSFQIAPGASVILNLTFTPSGDGIHEAILEFPSNDPTFPVVKVSLFGAGLLSQLETWRTANFGVNASASMAMNESDPDGDGLSNLVEFALGLNPSSPTSQPCRTARSEGFLHFTYPRSKAALEAGLLFRVEASESLLESVWTPVPGEVILDDDGVMQNVRASLPEEGASRFVRLMVTTP